MSKFAREAFKLSSTKAYRPPAVADFATAGAHVAAPAAAKGAVDHASEEILRAKESSSFFKPQPNIRINQHRFQVQFDKGLPTHRLGPYDNMIMRSLNVLFVVGAGLATFQVFNMVTGLNKKPKPV